MRSFSTFLIVVLLSVVALGAVTHAVVPHVHDGNESLWQELHAALRFEQKAFFVAYGVVFALGVAIVANAAVVQAVYIPVPAYLRRGIAKHRRFG